MQKMLMTSIRINKMIEPHSDKKAKQVTIKADVLETTL
jgi:hypothetical protein